MKIWFWFNGKGDNATGYVADRNWEHVPRIGDRVHFDINPDHGPRKEQFRHGTVTGVTWCDGFIVPEHIEKLFGESPPVPLREPTTKEPRIIVYLKEG